ncbi:MAG: hypothetical protein GY841_10260 [FCB group bacterium]|nr:hypothetical protein [FCB group bacterium]
MPTTLKNILPPHCTVIVEFKNGSVQTLHEVASLQFLEGEPEPPPPVFVDCTDDAADVGKLCDIIEEFGSVTVRTASSWDVAATAYLPSTPAGHDDLVLHDGSFIAQHWKWSWGSRRNWPSAVGRAVYGYFVPKTTKE